MKLRERFPLITYGIVAADIKDRTRAYKKIFGAPQIPQSNQQDAIATHVFQTFPLAVNTSLLCLNHSDAKKTPFSERKGVLCFNGLVIEIDRVLDESPLLKREKDPAFLKAQILSHRIKGSPFTLRNLYDATHDFFIRSAEKTHGFDTFLDMMLTFQTNLDSFTPGAYGFEQARHYKETTNHAWVENSFHLAGVKDTKAIQRILDIGTVAQLDDDRGDFIDYFEQSPNMYIGLTKDSGEFEQFAQWVQIQGSDSHLQDSTLLRRELRKCTPQTQEQYDQHIENKIAYVHSRLIRWYLARRYFGKEESNRSFKQLISSPSLNRRLR